MDRAKATAWGLALAGLVPFAGCAVMVVAYGPPAVDWTGALIAYAAVILSFLGGARWGAELARETPDPVRLILSNLPAIGAWLALVIIHVPASARLGLLAAALALVWVWDRGPAEPWYRALRTTATVGAVLSLILAAVAGA
ncbi:MAG: DUF3429 domain-containing protein [Brevundimonas sp.]|uniref:DUF3429 domain-containing protein n=1 Tax=Brevundimonas sp. TaxID=1871086 RepID=UPI0027357445|nr:DUF3429 domain-containing protein [Brevundimonas sp.]MDP3403940.1 DUF3429 domain-containing protein [Brevundimonas sp.]